MPTQAIRQVLTSFAVITAGAAALLIAGAGFGIALVLAAS